MLERDGFKSLLEFARKPDGKLKIYEDDEENIRLWFAMGLIDIQIDTQEPVARLSLAADAQEILDRLNASDWRKECRESAILWKRHMDVCRRMVCLKWTVSMRFSGNVSDRKWKKQILCV